MKIYQFYLLTLDGLFALVGSIYLVLKRDTFSSLVGAVSEHCDCKKIKLDAFTAFTQKLKMKKIHTAGF